MILSAIGGWERRSLPGSRSTKAPFQLGTEPFVFRATPESRGLVANRSFAASGFRLRARTPAKRLNVGRPGQKRRDAPIKIIGVNSMRAARIDSRKRLRVIGGFFIFIPSLYPSLRDRGHMAAPGKVLEKVLGPVIAGWVFRTVLCSACHALARNCSHRPNVIASQHFVIPGLRINYFA